MADGAEALRAGLGGLGRGFGAVVATFHEVVGPDLARVATPTALRNGTLSIRCSSSAWAQTITMMELELVERLAPRLGRGTVTRIVARAGGPPPRLEAQPRPEPPPVDEGTRARMEALVAHIDDPALRAKMLAAAIATARRRAMRPEG
ncbi:MAG: hypothetical protein JWL76_1924 [Thermoleophilia bacterium]|nr:hypothetical protein [Thermoleophilia bacterium]